jgi:hypothetical protein
LVIAGGVLCAGLILIPASVIALAVWNQATRKDTVEDYTFLCQALFQGIPVEGSPQRHLSQAENEALAPEHRAELSRISRRSRDLAPIARSVSILGERAQALQLDRASGSKFVFGLAELCLGFSAHQPQIMAAGGEKALGETEKAVDRAADFNQLIRDVLVLQVRLAKLAPQFSGPNTNAAATLACSLAVDTGGFLSPASASLAVTNLSGLDLHDCVTMVRLLNASGDSSVSYYFLPAWQQGRKCVARYEDGATAQVRLDDVTTVEVDFWARELSAGPFLLKKPPRGWPEPK